MMFQNPLAFLFLFGIPLAVLMRHRKTKRDQSGIPFPSVAIAAGIPRSFRQRLSFIKPLLLIFAMVLLVIALARPRYGMEEVKTVNKGIAIEMVVDHSGSMGAGIRYEGKNITRLDAVKLVFTNFVMGNGKELEGRSNDLVGLVSFARYADTVYPLSLSHTTITGFLKNVSLVTNKNEDGTAIGDAIALGSARLKTVETELEKQGNDVGYIIKSKIIILLTDGQNNWGKLTPLEAAELARDWGIQIYTIGIGGEDINTLAQVSNITGGKHFTADNVSGLTKVYEEIDSLEKSEIESVKYMDYKEAFLPFVIAALFSISLYIILSATLLRRIP
jgi:Ca-activated chloride channel family protein